MDTLVLCYRQEPICEFVLDGRPLEVGRDENCDIVVRDRDVAERHLLVHRAGGTVMAYDVRGGRARGRQAVSLPPGQSVELGEEHSLLRLPQAAPSRSDSEVHTDPVGCSGWETVGCDEADPARLSIIVGRGTEARRQSVGGRPLVIGSAKDSDLVLVDRTVSARHCRIEPLDDGVLIRDLDSTNGTWVDGVRVMIARGTTGTKLRLGRTELTLVARGRRRDGQGTGLVAEAPDMMRVLGEVEHFAKLSWPVLIQGESGAGKEGIASALHRLGPRRKGPFVALNAGGLPRELIESELFGHERGAFTGAVGSHKGVFEQASGGTLFLDEIGELPLELQTRLLRVLETWKLRRVGGENVLNVDVRLVCATHRDLCSMVAAGAFRADLYYRIARLVLEVPPLRQRPEDVRALAEHFLQSVADEVGPRRLTGEAMSRLLAYSWPGNARELRNVLCSAAVSSGCEWIDAADVERALARMAGPGAVVQCNLQEVVERHRGNMAAAARALGIPRSTLRDRLRASGATIESPA